MSKAKEPIDNPKRDSKLLVEVLLRHKTRAAAKDLIDGLLTDEERREFARRVEIVRLLKSGIPQREISKRLGVGIATVTRGSNELRRGRLQNL